MPDIRNEIDMNKFMSEHTFLFGKSAFFHDESPEIIVCKCKITNINTGKVIHDDTYEVHACLNDYLVHSEVHEDHSVTKSTSDNLGLKTNPLWYRVLKDIGKDNITKFTEERRKRHDSKTNKKEIDKIREQQKGRSKKLEELFTAKLEVFNIDAIKNSKNKILRGKIRRSQTIYELNAYTTILLMEEMKLAN